MAAGYWKIATKPRNWKEIWIHKQNETEEDLSRLDAVRLAVSYNVWYNNHMYSRTLRGHGLCPMLH